MPLFKIVQDEDGIDPYLGINSTDFGNDPEAFIKDIVEKDVYTMLVTLVVYLDELARTGQACPTDVELIQKRTYVGDIIHELTEKFCKEQSISCDTKQLLYQYIFGEILKKLALLKDIAYFQPEVCGQRALLLF